MKYAPFVGAAGLVLAVSTSSLAAISDPVRIDGGLLSGTWGTTADMRVFKGVPFAAPPIGPLRWRAPQPVAAWSGVRTADEFGPRCMQGGGGGGRNNATPTMPIWPRDKAKAADSVMILGEKVAAGTAPDPARLAFYDAAGQ
jgi:hypothetical protein